MNRRQLLARALAIASASVFPLSSRGPELIRVWHRYDDGVRLVAGVVQRFRPPYRNPWVADVINPATGNALGVLDRAGRYIPWYEMP